MRLEHPDWLLYRTTQRVDEDFVFVEFEYDVWEPPTLFSLKALPLPGLLGQSVLLADALRGH